MVNTRSRVVLVAFITALTIVVSACESESPSAPTPPSNPNPPSGPVGPNVIDERPAPPAGFSYLEPDLLPDGSPNPKAMGPVTLMDRDAAGNWTVEQNLTVRFIEVKPLPGSRILSGGSGPDICRDNFGARTLSGCFEFKVEVCAPEEIYTSVQFYLGDNPDDFPDSDYLTGAGYRRGGGCDTLDMTRNGPWGVKTFSGGAKYLKARSSRFVIDENGKRVEQEIRLPPLYLGYWH